jgi:very-short-patch-repair endonuclease
MLSSEGRWLAAVLACGHGAALSHAPAAQLQWLMSRDERWALHVSVPRGSRRHLPGIVIHRPRSLPPTDVTTYARIPTTTPTRTVWDLASVLSPLQLRRVFEKAERKGKLRRRRLAALLAESPTHKGAGRIRSLLATRRRPYAETRSLLEDLLLRICSEHSLPEPLVNAPLLGYEPDFLWPDARFIVEADGGDHLTPAQRDADNERDAILGRAGYLVRRYSSIALEDEDAVAGEVLAILAERLPRFAARAGGHLAPS